MQGTEQNTWQGQVRHRRTEEGWQPSGIVRAVRNTLLHGRKRQGTAVQREALHCNGNTVQGPRTDRLVIIITNKGTKSVAKTGWYHTGTEGVRVSYQDRILQGSTTSQVGPRRK